MACILDLEESLQIEKRILSNAIRERDKLVHEYCPQGYSKGRSFVDADSIKSGFHRKDIVEVIVEINRWDDKISLQEEKIEVLENDIKEIKNSIKKLRGLKKKIKYMQEYEGKSLKLIAQELGYSYDHIRHLAGKGYKRK